MGGQSRGNSILQYFEIFESNGTHIFARENVKVLRIYILIKKACQILIMGSASCRVFLNGLPLDFFFFFNNMSPCTL